MMKTDILVCPVCGGELVEQRKALKCPKGHSFDIARQGYVNLLTGSKPGSAMGDSRSMADARRKFLSGGYYDVLARFLADFAKTRRPKTALDICCGEGYYSSFITKKIEADVYAFDLSRDMVKFAAQRKAGVNCFVANLRSIPIKNNSIDFAFELFAPFKGEEFARILSKSGVLAVAVPGERHLWDLKQLMYKKPYLNDGKLPDFDELTLKESVAISGEISVSDEDKQALLEMTPYYYRTSEKDKQKLLQADCLTTQIEFKVGIYEGKNNA